MSRADAIVRGLAIFAAAWQALWLVGDATVRRIVADNPSEPAVIVLGASMVAWLVLWPSLFGRWRSRRRLRVAQVTSMLLVVVAGLLLLADSSAVGADGWFVGASVLNLGTGLAGLYLDRRTGLAVVIAVVSVEVIVIVAVYAQNADAWPLVVDLVYPAYALTLGLASVAARHALLGTARTQDASEDRLSRQQRIRAANELTDAAVTAAETRLHETVLNTLTAIVRGGFDHDEATTARLRKRAAESAEVLQSIADGTDVAARWEGDLRIDLAGAIVDLESAGVTVHVSGALDAIDSRIGAGPYTAMGSAVREALINVARHAQASRVEVHGEVRTVQGQTWWRVGVRDDGRGFDANDRGFGLQSVVEEAIRAHGGRVAILSSDGTEVTIEVPVPSASAGVADLEGGYLRAIALPVVTAFTAFTLYTIAATWQYAASPAANAATAALFIAVSAVVLIAARTTHETLMPWWVVVVVAVGVPVMTQLERLTEAAPNPTGDWTSEAGAALLFVVVATGPVWAFPAAVASWFVAQELHWIELTQPGMFVIVVGALLGLQLRRADARTREMDREAILERGALAASQHRLARTRSRYQDVDTSGLIELLEGLAAGSLDPRDERVRELCVREERMLRSVIKLHPESIGVHRDLVSLAAAARDAGVDLTITCVEDVSGDARLTSQDVAQSLLFLARDGSQARASITRDAVGCVFRLVVQLRDDAVANVPRGVEVLDADSGLVSLEERCAAGSISAVASLDAGNGPRSEDG